MEKNNNEFRNFIAALVVVPAMYYFASDEGRILRMWPRRALIASLGLLACWLIYPYVRDNTKEAWSRMSKSAWERMSGLVRLGRFRELGAFLQPFIVFLL